MSQVGFSNDTLNHRVPRIAVTMGDVAGIGPEIIAKALTSKPVLEDCRPIVLGHPDILRRALKLIDSSFRVDPVPAAQHIPGALQEKADDRLCCFNPGSDDVLHVPAGQGNAVTGEAAYDSLIAAIELARTGEVDAIVTAPLNKKALREAGRNYPGHTEILAERCGVKEYAMMLWLPFGEGITQPFGLSVAHVTLHTSLRNVPRQICSERISETITLLDHFIRTLGCGQPRVGVCALNPHGREFGNEESRIIAPAIDAATGAGINVQGPFPADTLFQRAAQAAEFDGIVAMYHDQGHIAFKLLGFDRAVNVTLGLPVIRTSPSQGTAYDIAWQGVARGDGMRSAIRAALELVHHRSDQAAARSAAE